MAETEQKGERVRMRMCLDGQSKTERSVLALGMFDGMHRGHQALLQRARRLAKRQGLPLVTCTFATHPMELIAPEKCPPMLTTLEERARAMELCGVELLCVQPFDRQTMNQKPEEYIAELCRRFHPLSIVAGYNFTFGKAGEGNPPLLRELGKAFGFSAEIVPQITLDGQEISSTAIRALLGRGEVERARDLLDRPYLRQAAVAAREGEKISLVMAPNGKQDVPEGLYRVTLEAEGKELPTLLAARTGGRAETRLMVPLALAEEVNLRFFARKRADGQGRNQKEQKLRVARQNGLQTYGAVLK